MGESKATSGYYQQQITTIIFHYPSNFIVVNNCDLLLLIGISRLKIWYG